MATRKKRSTRATKASGARVAGLPKTKKYGGKTYTKSGCSKTKADAKKAAERLRKRSKNPKNVRIEKNPAGGYCLFTRSKGR